MIMHEHLNYYLMRTAIRSNQGTRRARFAHGPTKCQSPQEQKWNDCRLGSFAWLFSLHNSYLVYNSVYSSNLISWCSSNLYSGRVWAHQRL